MAALDERGAASAPPPSEEAELTSEPAGAPAAIAASSSGATTPADRTGVDGGGWRELATASSIDGTLQPSRLWLPPPSSQADAPKGAPLPLVLHLHTWSAAHHHEQFLVGKRGLVVGCEARGWAILVPNFRGRNNKPEACCSPLATADIYDALATVAAELEADGGGGLGPVFIHGVSGGGHMGLHLLIDNPTRWAALSLWVPITDLARWHDEDEAADDGRYWRDVEACCGGPPGPGTEEEYCKRSPLWRLSSPSVAGVPVDLNAGVRDGHAGAVPIGHTLRAFDALAEANGVAGRYVEGEGGGGG